MKKERILLVVTTGLLLGFGLLMTGATKYSAIMMNAVTHQSQEYVDFPVGNVTFNGVAPALANQLNAVNSQLVNYQPALGYTPASIGQLNAVNQQFASYEPALGYTPATVGQVNAVNAQLASYEVTLPTPGVSGYVLSSTTGNTRSWVNANAERWHGIVARPVAPNNPLPTNLTTTTFTLGATANPVSYYYNGVLVAVTADKTTTLSDGAGFYYIYFNAATGNLANSKNFPGLSTASNVLVATVLWNGSNYGIVNDERHGYKRNLDWHLWAHLAVGVRYGTGVTLSVTGTGSTATMATTAGTIYDEDIAFTVDAQTTCRLLWETSATTMGFDATLSTTPFKYGTSGRPVVVKASDYSLVTVPDANNRYVNFFVYGTTGVLNPIYVVCESVSDTTASAGGYTSTANARAVPWPNLSQHGMTPELRPLYRVVVRADGAVQALTTADDYRTVSSLPQSAGTASTTAGAVSVVPATGITSTNVQSALEELAAGGGGLSDAPSDGSTYARKDATWVAIPSADATSYGNPGGVGPRNSFVTITASEGLVVEYTILTLIDGVQNPYAPQGSPVFSGGTVDGTVWIQFQFESAVIVNEMKLYSNTDSNNGTWQFQGSNNGSSWTNVGSAFAWNVVGTSLTVTSMSANTTRYSYYRLLGVSGNSNGSNYQTEAEFKISR